jgi:hypothetical protein
MSSGAEMNGVVDRVLSSDDACDEFTLWLTGYTLERPSLLCNDKDTTQSTSDSIKFQNYERYAYARWILDSIAEQQQQLHSIVQQQPPSPTQQTTGQQQQQQQQHKKSYKADFPQLAQVDSSTTPPVWPIERRNIYILYMGV